MKKNLVKAVGVTVLASLAVVTVKKSIDTTNQKKEEKELLDKEIDNGFETGEAVGTVMSKFPNECKACDMAKIYKVADEYMALYKRTYKNPECIAENLPDIYEYDRKEFLTAIRKAENYVEVIKTIDRYKDYIRFNNNKVDNIIGCQ